MVTRLFCGQKKNIQYKTLLFHRKITRKLYGCIRFHRHLQTNMLTSYMLTSINIQTSYTQYLQVLNRSSKAGAALVKTIASPKFESTETFISTSARVSSWKEKLPTCSTSSATCNFIQSLSLSCK